MLIHFTPIWTSLRTFEIVYEHLVHFVFIWYIFSGFGIIHQEKSGNPGAGATGVHCSVAAKQLSTHTVRPHHLESFS
jgi:hypothetical protein